MGVGLPVAEALSVHGWIAVGVLAAATALFISKKLPVAVTALAIPVVLFATGTLPECGKPLLRLDIGIAGVFAQSRLGRFYSPFEE